MPLSLSLSGASTAIQPPAPIASDMASQWALDPAIDFLNHGSFGARTHAVMAAQARLRAAYEAKPIEWLGRRAKEMIAHARHETGEFLGCAADSIGFVTNATDGINAVLRSLSFKPGDELLTTTHVYNAVRMAMRHVAARWNASYREIDLPLPIKSPGEIIDAVSQALSDRTRLLVIDHVTSPTAIIFPVKEIVEIAAKRGIDVLIDGAHAPGMLPLDIDSIGAAYYAGNLHKWVCAPSGAAFIHARADRAAGVHPTTISHYYQQGFVAEFEWQGTRDITPWLCVGESIRFFQKLGWERVMAHNHALATWTQAMLCERWSVEPASPRDGSMLGSMATVLLPEQERLKAKHRTFDAFKAPLYDRFGIEVPVVDWGGRWWVRPCCQVYNAAAQYERLAESVLTLVREA